MKFLLGTLTGIVSTLLFVVALGMYSQTTHGQNAKCRAMLGNDIETAMQDPLQKTLIEQQLTDQGKTLDEVINAMCTSLVESGQRF